MHLSRSLPLALLTGTLALTGTSVALPPAAPGAAIAAPGPDTPTTAWRHGALDVDTEGLLSRSDIVLEVAPWRTDQAMPIGNGTLGAAVWAADGFTAQLNRGDTFPDLRSAGHLTIPGLYDLSSADDYAGRVDLHDAQLVQRGGGLRATTYVDARADQVVVEVTGARPDHEQTVELALWDGREPTPLASGDVASLGERWTDEVNGRSFGQVAALTAEARDVQASVVDEHTVALTFRPERDGSFRIVAGVPAWDGADQRRTADRAVSVARNQERRHLAWWHDYWASVAPMRVDSTDGKARYFEALRAQYLYMAGSSMRGEVPASHGGVTSMFSPYRDDIHWSPDSWWHFNLRQPVWANLGAGTAELNRPYADLYLDLVDEMRAWTRHAWPEAEGICVPEFLRYDGTAEAACSSSKEPDWLNRILSTGPEVIHNLYLQAQYTGDDRLLERSYPLMKGVVEFYLSVLEEGEDGLLHLHHVNSLEVQWDTTDPTPDVAAMRTVFPLVADLAADHGDRALARELREAYPRLPELPTTTRNGKRVIAWSATEEPAHNTQNPDLEAVWPWRAVDLDSRLAHDTFTERVYLQSREWASDAQWAAWLGRPDDVASLLELGTTDFQAFPNGFAAHNKKWDQLRGGGFYDTWNAVVASTLQDGLVQEHDGVLSVGRGWPEAWDATGAVMVAGGHRVSVETSGGSPTLVGIEPGSKGSLTVTNPWPGSRVEAVDRTGRVIARTSGDVLPLALKPGEPVVLQKASSPVSSYRFARLGGEQATTVQKLGTRSYGVDESTPQVISDVVEVIQPDRFRILVRPEVGTPTYVDRHYRLTSVPAEIEDTVMIRTANGQAKVVSDDYITLAISRPTTIWVAFDLRGEGTWWPTWLTEGGWTRTDQLVGTGDRPLLLFHKEVPAGRFSLGGTSGINGQGGNSYLAFVEE